MKQKLYNVGVAALTIGLLGLISKIIGFFRELALASKFGAGSILDTYYTAFRLPDIVYNLLVLGTLSVAFIPVFLDYANKDRREAKIITNSIFNIATLGMFIISVVLIIFTEPLIRVIAPGFSGQQFQDTVMLTRIMLLSPVLFTASSVLGSYVTALGRFVAAGLAPIFYNIGILIGLYLFYPKVGLIGLALGVILGALMHFLIQAIAALRLNFAWQAVIEFSHKGVRQIALLMIPRLLSLDLTYISLLIASIIGSTLMTGSIAVFNLANNLQAVAIGVFAISSATAVFPLLSNAHAKGETEKFIQIVRDNIIQIGFFMVPVTVFTLIFRAHIVRLAYGYGNFDWSNTIYTFDVLGIMAFALLSQGLSPLLARAFYAKHDTKTPLLVSLVAIIANIVISFSTSSHYGVNGIALGFTVSSLIHALLLFVIFRIEIRGQIKDMESNYDLPILTAYTKLAVAVLFAGTVAYALLYVLAGFLDTRTVAGIFSQTLISGVLSILIYGALTHWLGFREPLQIALFMRKPIEFMKDRFKRLNLLQ